MVWRALAMRCLVVGVVMAATPGITAELPTAGTADVYYSITPEQVAAVLKQGGFKTKIVKDKPKAGEKPSWTVNGESKEPFYVSADLRACDAEGYPKGCLGIRLYASMIVEKGDQAAARRTAEEYNREYYIGKAYVTEDGKRLVFENYLMIEGGVTVRNLEENLDNFLAGYNSMLDVFEKKEKAVEA